MWDQIYTMDNSRFNPLHALPPEGPHLIGLLCGKPCVLAQRDLYVLLSVKWKDTMTGFACEIPPKR